MKSPRRLFVLTSQKSLVPSQNHAYGIDGLSGTLAPYTNSLEKTRELEPVPLVTSQFGPPNLLHSSTPFLRCAWCPNNGRKVSAT